MTAAGTADLTQHGKGAPPPRLLFVVNEAFFFLSHRLPIAEAAQRLGWDVHVAAPADHVWAPEDFSVAELVKRGFTFHAIPLSRRGINPWRDLRTLIALVRLYRALRPDLVHHLTVKPNLYGGIAARMTGVPAVAFTVTGLGQVFVGRGPWMGALRAIVTRGLTHAFAHRNARVWFQNRDDRRTLLAAGAVAADRTAVVTGSGVDLRRFSADAFPAGPPVVVLAARLIWEKGVGEFLAAARQLRGDGVVARFVLVGGTQPSNPRSIPQATLEAWHREGAVEWAGYRTDMVKVLAECHIVCLPTSYGEGVPKILLEAAAAGRPAVTTAVAGCKDAVVDGETGLLVRSGDVPGLAAALRRLIEDEPLRLAMGRAARARAEAEFDERSIVGATLEAYTRLLQGAVGVLPPGEPTVGFVLGDE